MGIEPTSKAWEAFVLPLNYTRASANFRDRGGGWQPPRRCAPHCVAKTTPSCNNKCDVCFIRHNMISVTVNGESRRLSAMSCSELIASLDIAGKRVALERNGEIVPRSRLGDEMLADGDRIEIVVAVGGG